MTSTSRQGVGELMGLPGGLFAPGPAVDKILLFFTDGQPTLPHGPDWQPRERMKAAAGCELAAAP